ncbi:hypothetical protein CFT85387_08670 [Campylobacter fetus subsp. testudinum]|uniref:hypothetical protein n=1 Tax=Campylobacter fetus TaxID=196 RepID=UPI00082794B6|nr:hypothetical protein [Campylobacter fetus]OCR98901.1 hypothetical protein CFT85387_08670 [Campylobacter fetus subsp. testudinum]
MIQKTVDIINSVTSDSSSVESAKGKVDTLKESIDEAGLNKIALTTENDTITGTEGGDLISGVVAHLLVKILLMQETLLMVEQEVIY